MWLGTDIFTICHSFFRFGDMFLEIDRYVTINFWRRVYNILNWEYSGKELQAISRFLSVKEIASRTLLILSAFGAFEGCE